MHEYHVGGHVIDLDQYILYRRMPLDECQRYLIQHQLPTTFDAVKALYYANPVWPVGYIGKLLDDPRIQTLSDEDHDASTRALFGYVMALRNALPVIVPASITNRVPTRRRLGLS